MALTKVGASANVTAVGLSAGGTLTVTFTPTSSFATGDLLVFFVATGARSAGSNYTHLQGLVPADRNTVTTNWTYLDYNATGGGEFYQNTPYWSMVYHTVTSGEAGASPIVCTVTLGTVSTVGAGTGYMLGMAGPAVRGATSIVSTFVPADTLDTDNALTISGASPQLGTFPVANSDWYVTEGTGGTILFYGASSYYTSMLTTSVAWGGPTELDDDAFIDLWTAPTPNEDLSFSSAYELLDPGTAWPADTATRSFTTSSGNPTNYVWRAAIAVNGDGPAVEGTVTASYVPTRVDIAELPYSVHTGMV